MRSLHYSPGELWGLIHAVFSLPHELSFAMDRTNWKFGSHNINMLTIAVTYKGLAIPVLWAFLPKFGNSKDIERIYLVMRLLKFVPLSRIQTLLCDREFIGFTWLNWLMTQNIPFVIRSKNNIQVANAKGILLPVSLLLRNIKPGKYVCFPKKRQTMGVLVYVVAARLSNGELLVLLTNNKPELAMDLYKTRWEIETLFSCLKKRGLNYENTHLTQHKRLSNLMFTLTLVVIIAYKNGEIAATEKELKLKKHGYPAKSIFRIGLQKLTKMLFSQYKKTTQICNMLKAIFKPPINSNLPQSEGGVL